MARKWKVDELIELALIYAVQDREGFAEANADGDRWGEEAKELAAAMRAYHKRRYRKTHLTELERQCDAAETVSIFDLDR